MSILQQTGFLNREELHNVDVQTAKEGTKDIEVGFFRIGRWVWSHDPESYASENFTACLASVSESRPFRNTNIPPGHVYKPWSLDTETKRMVAGVKSDLKLNGDWSA